MLNPKLIPTRLVEKAERPPVPIREPAPIPHWRVLYLFWRCLRLLGIALVVKAQGKLSKHKIATLLRHEFEFLGGLWLKLGQLLSLRTDVFPYEFCSELAHMQDRATGFPPALARALIEAELKRPISAVFEIFEDHPFAAASIAQIHRAFLAREKVWVAVKVLRPYAASAFRREMALARIAVQIVGRTGLLPNLHWDSMIWELNQILAEEVDFHYEAGSMRRMRKNLKKHNIYVPKVFPAYSSGTVLVMEYLEAALMSDLNRISIEDPPRARAWCEENRIDPHKVARRLFRSLWRQLLEENLFHADMHPGNIIVLRNSRLALIDFGAVGSMEREYQQRYTMFMQAVIRGDYSKAADLLFLLSGALPPTDLAEGKENLIRALRSYSMRTFSPGLPYSLRSMSNVANELVKILFDAECAADWSFLRITRAQETVDQSLMHLYPDVNYTKWTYEYFRRFEARRLRNALRREEIWRYASSYIDLLLMPERLSDLLTFSSWVERRKALVFQGSASKLANIVSLICTRITLVIGALGLYLLGLFVHQYQPAWLPLTRIPYWNGLFDWAPRLNVPSWILVAFVMLLAYQTSRRISVQLSRKERSID